MQSRSRQVTPLKGKKRVSSNSTKPRQSVTPISKKRQTNKVSVIESLESRRKKIPGWLKSLKILENSSSFLAFCLICSSLGIYGWIVLTQQTWSQQYRNLENLQRQERDFTVTSETIKNELAEETKIKETDLIAPTPEQTIFLKSSNSRPLKSANQELETNNFQPIKLPLGY